MHYNFISKPVKYKIHPENCQEKHYGVHIRSGKAYDHYHSVMNYEFKKAALERVDCDNNNEEFEFLDKVFNILCENRYHSKCRSYFGRF